MQYLFPKFLFPIFLFFFSFFVFFIFFLFFPFSFSFRFSFSFLLFLHAQAIHGRIRSHRSHHARFPVSLEFREWAPPLARDSRPSLSLSRALFSPANQKSAWNARPRSSSQQWIRCGARHRLDLSAFFLAARARRSTAQSQPFVPCTRDLKPEAARSRIHSRTNSNVKPISSRGTEAEPKQKGPITGRHVATAADLKNKRG